MRFRAALLARALELGLPKRSKGKEGSGIEHFHASGSPFNAKVHTSRTANSALKSLNVRRYIKVDHG